MGCCLCVRAILVYVNIFNMVPGSVASERWRRSVGWLVGWCGLYGMGSGLDLGWDGGFVGSLYALLFYLFVCICVTILFFLL